MNSVFQFIKEKWEDISGKTRRELEKVIQKRDKEIQKRDGVYFSKAEEIISLRNVSHRQYAVRADFDAIQRPNEHPFYTEAIKQAKDYNTRKRLFKVDDRSTRDHYDSDDGGESLDEGSSLRTNSVESTMARNRKRKLREIALGYAWDSLAAEIAHLIPRSYSCAGYYRKLIVQMTGIKFNEDSQSMNVNKKREEVLVHGLLKKESNKKSKPKRRKRNSSWEWVRVRNTGVKHNRATMARIFNQKFFLDAFPKLLLLPILDLDTVRMYTGGPFWAVVLAERPSVYKHSFIEQLEHATYAEVDRAVSTLQIFKKACAYSTVSLNSDFADLHDYEKNKVSYGVRKTKTEGARIPRLLVSQDDFESSRVRVGKVLFSMTDEKAHQTCDPFALLLKAVAVESSMQDEKDPPVLPCTT